MKAIACAIIILAMSIPSHTAFEDWTKDQQNTFGTIFVVFLAATVYFLVFG